MTDKQYSNILSPIQKLTLLAEKETVPLLSSIKQTNFRLVIAAVLTAKELKKQTVLLTELRDLIKAESKKSKTESKDKKGKKGGGSSFKPMSMKDTGMTAFMVVGMTAAIVGAAALIGLTPNVEMRQVITILAVTAALALMTPTFLKIFKTLSKTGKGIANRKGKLGKGGGSAAGILGLIGATALSLIGMAGIVVITSMLFQLVMPVTGDKLMTAIVIAGALYLMGMAFTKIMKAIKKIKTKHLKNAAIAIGVMIGAIVVASWAFQLIMPVPFEKLSAAFLIGLALIPVSFAFSLILKSIKKTSIKEVIFASLALPLIAIGIAGVAWIWNSTLPDDYKAPPLGWSLLAGISMLAFALSFYFIMKAVKGASVKQLIFGTAAIAAIAVGIVAAGWIFSYLAEEYKAPPVEWSLLSGLAMLAFAVPFVLITVIFKKMGVGVKDLFMGVLGIAAVAISVLAVSYLFAYLPSSWLFPPQDWVIGAAIALGIMAIPVGLIAAIIKIPAVGAVGFLLGVVGLIVLAVGMLAVAWIFSFMPDLGSIATNFTNALMTPINAMIDAFARLKDEIGVDNLLPMALGIAALGIAWLVFVGATAGASVVGGVGNVIGGLLDGIAGLFGSAAPSPLEILEKLAMLGPQIQTLADPLNMVAEAFGKFSVLVAGGAVEKIAKLVNAVVMPFDLETIAALGISDIDAYYDKYAATMRSVADSYGKIAKHSNNFNVDAIKASTELFNALAYLAANGSESALEKLGDKLIGAVEKLAEMIANFEGTVSDANENTKSATASDNGGSKSTLERAVDSGKSFLGVGSDTGGSNNSSQSSGAGGSAPQQNFDTSEIVSEIKKLQKALTVKGVKIQ